jgi:hypothetical protein
MNQRKKHVVVNHKSEEWQRRTGMARNTLRSVENPHMELQKWIT